MTPSTVRQLQELRRQLLDPSTAEDPASDQNIVMPPDHPRYESGDSNM
jgi:hypothetical protein